ncbi:MAG TPA: hypothetical protein VK741_21695 [Acetobacteraceae bacterium]|jgi:hypothetical protein|nr:hypothetical protein [Acetobacteraceae bacterium]
MMGGPDIIHILTADVRECNGEPLTRLRQVLQSFVNDIEAAHGEGAPDLEHDWLDLFLTYQIACATLEATEGAV